MVTALRDMPGLPLCFARAMKCLFVQHFYYVLTTLLDAQARLTALRLLGFCVGRTRNRDAVANDIFVKTAMLVFGTFTAHSVPAERDVSCNDVQCSRQ